MFLDLDVIMNTVIIAVLMIVWLFCSDN